MNDAYIGLMSRRGALERLGILAGGVISASVMSGVAAGCRATVPNGTYVPVSLDAAQYELISHISEMIIPETDTPGAIGAGVPSFIDEMLTSWYSDADRTKFVQDLGNMNAVAVQTYATPFLEATTDQQTSFLKAMAAGTPLGGPLPVDLSPLFKQLKELTVVGYYTSQVGATQELRTMPMGEYRADIPYDEVGRAWT